MDPIAQWWADLAEHAAARGFRFRKRGRGPQVDPGVLDVHIPAPALVDEHTDDQCVDQLRPLVAAIRETDPWRSTRPPTVVLTRLWLSMLINPLPVWPTPAVPISWGPPG